MFCHKCGAQMPDDSAFCAKCGARLINAETQTTLSADLHPESEPIQQTKQEPYTDPVPAPRTIPNVPVMEEKPAKKRSKNLPLLIVVLIFLGLILMFVIVTAIGGSTKTESPNTDTAVTENAAATSSTEEIQLSRTFSDRGISFNYPAEWDILEDGSDLTIIYFIGSDNNADHRITFKVSETLDMDPLYVFTGDEAAVRDAVNEYRVFMEYKDMTLGDIPAKYLKCQMDGLTSPDISESCYYIIGSECYWIHLTYTASDEDKYRSLFEQIIDSYTVTTDTEAVEEVSTVNEDDIIREAYAEKVGELSAVDSDMTFSLIDLTADDVFELVADKPGYYVNVYAYDDGNVVPIIEDWGYGAGGNNGYEYLPGKNIIRNTDMDGGGREMYTSYMCVDSNHKVQYAYDDVLGYIYPSSYYFGQREITESEYNAYQISGEFSSIEGIMGAAQMTSQLSEGINIRSFYDGEMTFNGVPVSSFIGVPIYSITYFWGEPSEYTQSGAYNAYRYDGIEFVTNDAGKINTVELTPELCSIDGNTLDKNRDGLVGILGLPTNEGWEADYCMYYSNYTADYSINLDLRSTEEAPFAMRIWTND